MPDAYQTLITIATYNELENLPELVEQIFRHLPQAALLVIDDNSPDGTGTWVDKESGSDPRVHCLHRSGKLGLGTAIVEGMKYAIEHDYRYVVNMDADFSHDPRYLPQLVEGMDPHGEQPVDVMIGSRYVPGGRIEGWPWIRHAMSRGVNLYARWLLNLSPTDCSGGYRCYRVSRLKSLDFSTIRSHGYSFQEEILWRLARSGCRIAETPIKFRDRERGSSKINAAEARGALSVILALAWQQWFGRAQPPRDTKGTP